MIEPVTAPEMTAAYGHAWRRLVVRARPAAVEILEEECRAAGFPVSQVTGPGRYAELVAVRVVIADRLRAETALSLPAIGRLLKRDHTTILHYLRSAGGRA